MKLLKSLLKLKKVKYFPISRFIIQGESMTPALNSGMEVITFNLAYLFKVPKINDLVVVDFEGKMIIKRVKKVRKNEVFIEGDNLEKSTDSNKFGWVEISRIRGKVIFKL